jgi:hypothetical protein
MSSAGMVGLCRWLRPDYLQLVVSLIRLRRLRIVIFAVLWSFRLCLCLSVVVLSDFCLRPSDLVASVCRVCLSRLRLSVRLCLSGLPRSSDMPGKSVFFEDVNFRTFWKTADVHLVPSTSGMV